MVNNENALDVWNVLTNKGLNINLNDNDIEKCYVKKAIINRRKSERNVLYVHFCNYEIKQKIMKAKIRVKKKLNSSVIEQSGNNNIYINHSLTNYTKALFIQGKKVKKEKNFKFLWFNKSNLMLKKDENSRVIIVRSFDELMDI